MSKNIIITIKKELRSIFRDKKTLKNIFLLPLLIPVFVFLYGYIYDSMDEEKSYLVGVDYKLSKDEISIMESHDLDYKEYNDIKEMKKEYDSNKISGYISYDKDNNRYLVYTDTSNTDGVIVNELLNSYFKDYSIFKTNEYLTKKGINLEEAYDTFLVENIELSEENNLFLIMVLSLSFTYVVMAICLATSNMAISTTATERENGTLETLLTFPVSKKDLILGKYLSSVIVGTAAALFGLIITLVSILIAKNTFDIYKVVNLDLNIINILLSIIIIVFASLFISGVALALTAFSKTYKEAQSSTQLLSMIGVVPMFVSLMEVEITTMYYAIPIFNHEQILMDLYTGTFVFSNFIIALLSTIVFIFLIVKYIIKAYNSEKVLFTN